MQRRPFLSAILLALFVALSACRTAPAQHLGADAEATRIIYVVRRTWHIDIAFPVQDLEPPLTALQDGFPGVAYLEFGFGDRHYLMSRHHGAGNMLAALWPGPGLILLTALTGTPQEAFGSTHVIEIALTREQSHDLQRFVWQSLSRDSMPLKPVAAGPYEGSAFYAAVPNYSALYTCNTWAAQALQSASLAVSSTGVEFAGQVWMQVQRLAPQP
jgi:uncharacterized protein (TIGR02117 family)